MNDKPNWHVAHVDDIERRGRDIPVRERLGIHAFGVNGFTPSEDGTLVSDHDEAGTGQEELYVVLDGKGPNGPSFDASLTMRVRPSSRRTAAAGFPGSYGLRSAMAGRARTRP